MLVRGIQSAMEAAGGVQRFTWRDETFRPGRQAYATGPGIVDVVTHEITAHGDAAHRRIAEVYRALEPLQGSAGEGTLSIV
eukprot:5922136-Prorocentrum_lima.AAC.1